MRAEHHSITAENNAAIRALEALRPVGDRICDDRYAHLFVSEPLRSSNDLPAALQNLIADWENRFPGVCDAIVVRTRFIDDCLKRALREGLQQLVILGAGFDTRAFRIEGLKKKVAVFEIDHPATQETKRQRCRNIRAAFPRSMTFVPMDFGREDLGRKLCEHGFDGTRKTFFIWEGTTYYLAAAAVDDMLRCVSTSAAAGSAIVFDYLPPAVVEGTTRLAEARALAAALAILGEQFFFGIDPQKVRGFLAARGFTLTEHVNAAECARRYRFGANRDRCGSKMFFFVHARVKKRK